MIVECNSGFDIWVQVESLHCIDKNLNGSYVFKVCGVCLNLN